ncbi:MULTISPECIES: ABC transporter family substrate-binding protein [Amycolatopsis]|uniref:ABC transporter family substrate-binding protein n=1 Tax=Amycolatopsis dendrobii TaxID=2760662 RepID=A0A7W3VTL3_9PSEU|nr:MULTISPECIES: ABC transporter family substrate-binding protein [Amycolatopsis]MBB1152824.1 ABC transporter family substrate-binding protein [Amycolatopsis dendrobii]UKD52001.1 ABC transporter family substrate-binding protein [Amycolatopsis sp. FU40]
MLVTTRSRAAKLGAFVAGAALLLSACGGGGGGNSAVQTGQAFADCDKNPNTCNAAQADQLTQGGDVTYAIEKNVPNWNVISAEGNVFETGEVTKGLLPYTFYATPDLKPVLNKDFVESAEVTSTSPQTVVYKLNPKAQWSDGTPFSADDFIYNYKVQNGKDCPDCAAASTAGYDQVKSVTGSDGGKTVTVVFDKPFTDWKLLWSSGGAMYPAHLAKQHGDTNTPAGLASSFKWFGTTVPTWSGGPWKISKFVNNQSVTEVPNEKYWGAKPKLNSVIFRVITDATQEPTALQNNEVQVIYPQPQVDLINQVKNMPNISSFIGLGLTWEHFDFNLKNPALAQKPLRQALFTAVNRKDMIAKTVGQFTNKVEPLNNHNFVPQQTGYKDTVSATGQGSGDIEKAKKILTDAGYKLANNQLSDPSGKPVPELRIRYTVGNQIRQNECELFAQTAAQLGVKVKVQSTDDLGQTTTSGDYDVIVFAWVASPFPFGGAIQNWGTGQGNNYGKYSSPQVDSLMAQANAETDQTKAADLLNQADQIMSEDAYVLPLYQKPTFIASSDKIANIRNNSTLDGPVYNMAEWGIRK